MTSVFINNFRGFQNTFFHIQRVNFLVGENSTGKTSVLALIELLSTPDFWFNFDFNTGSYEFGGYNDIVSALSENKLEFQIGLCRPDKKNPELSASYMLHFRKGKDGLPLLVRFTQLCKKYIATVRVSKKQIAVRMNSKVPESLSFKSAGDCFAYMLQIPSEMKSGYKVLSGDKERMIRRMPVGNFPVILDYLFDEKELGFKIGPFAFPFLSMSFAALAPIRTKPKRTYDGYTKRFSPEGEHTPYIIRKTLSHQAKRSGAFRHAIEAFGKDSGLFKTLGITQFGRGSAAPFEVTVTLNKIPLRINSVGYGVSQSLPVVVELLTHGAKSWLAIQQPEVHLHPRAQAALGDVLFHSATDLSQTLFVETHSDYLLDRFRLNIRDKGEKDIAQVLFFERTEEGNSISSMVLDKLGDYPVDQPPGFRSFFLAEQKRILEV